MSPDNIPPKFLSIEFHTRFFPDLLLNRLRPEKEEGVSFPPSVYTEATIALAICGVLTAIGMPSAISEGSIIGWIIGGIGVAGILALFILSMKSGLEEPPSYDDFLMGIFFFFISLGISAGIFNGALKHSLPLGITGSLAGLIVGYVLGIFAGLYMQYLGWTAVLLNMLAGISIVGMVIVDLVLLFG
ncbi:MAG: hypothetical protein HY578_04635 [Nitrospinae bacterium]|nr:hypothetical protein [Nitrospinota bacterium]